MTLFAIRPQNLIYPTQFDKNMTVCTLRAGLNDLQVYKLDYFCSQSPFHRSLSNNSYFFYRSLYFWTRRLAHIRWSADSPWDRAWLLHGWIRHLNSTLHNEEILPLCWKVKIAEKVASVCVCACARVCVCVCVCVRVCVVEIRRPSRPLAAISSWTQHNGMLVCGAGSSSVFLK